MAAALRDENRWISGAPYGLIPLMAAALRDEDPWISGAHCGLIPLMAAALRDENPWISGAPYDLSKKTLMAAALRDENPWKYRKSRRLQAHCRILKGWCRVGIFGTLAFLVGVEPCLYFLHTLLPSRGKNGQMQLQTRNLRQTNSRTKGKLY